MNGPSKSIQVIISILLVPILAPNIVLAASVDSLHRAVTLMSQQEILTRVLDITGFTGKNGLSLALGTAEAKLIPLDSGRISLLRESITGDRIWFLVLKSVQVPTVYTKNKQDMKTWRDFEIWADPTSGCIIRIYSNTMDSATRLKYKPYYPQLEIMLLHNPNENCVGIPDIQPAFTLNKVFETAIDDLLRPTEIIVYYVNFSRRGSDPKPCWIIDFTGVPPFAKGGSHTDYNLNHDRKVIDVMTGGMVYYLFYSTKRE